MDHRPLAPTPRPTPGMLNLEPPDNFGRFSDYLSADPDPLPPGYWPWAALQAVGWTMYVALNLALGWGLADSLGR